jgi:hypothetical protein
MHSADSLRDRYLHGFSTPGEINAIALVYARLKNLPYPSALEEVHDGLGIGLVEDRDDPAGSFPWQEVSRSLVPLGRQWINGI